LYEGGKKRGKLPLPLPRKGERISEGRLGKRGKENSHLLFFFSKKGKGKVYFLQSRGGREGYLKKGKSTFTGKKLLFLSPWERGKTRTWGKRGKKGGKRRDCFLLHEKKKEGRVYSFSAMDLENIYQGKG